MEVFKDVFGYEGIYEVSNLGYVRSKDRKDFAGRIRKGKILSPSMSGGYLGVNLCKNSVTNYTKVHKIVAEAFLIKENKNLVINHLNGCKTDNRSENLEYCTQQENCRHWVIEKISPTLTNIISDKELVEILKSYHKKKSKRREHVKEVCKKYNLTKGVFYSIIKRTSPYMEKIDLQDFEKNNFEELKTKEINEIRDLRKYGFILKDISKAYNIDSSQVSKMCKECLPKSKKCSYKLF